MSACPVCAAATVEFGRMTVLGRYEAVCLRCPTCAFIHVDHPFWLEEAYASPLAASDVGGVDRNLCLARIVRAVIEGCFDHRGPFVDYGGGYGLLTRLMRDAGYDFYWHDTHCPNVYAEGFRAAVDGGVRYHLLTAMEVLEHLPDPLEAFTRMAGVADNLLLMTHLVADPPPVPGTWWYYGPDHGQHVSFFSRRTMEILAGRFARHYMTDGRSLHLFAAQPVSPAIFRLLTWPPFATLFGAVRRRPSLLPGDFESRRGRS